MNLVDWDEIEIIEIFTLNNYVGLFWKNENWWFVDCFICWWFTECFENIDLLRYYCWREIVKIARNVRDC